MDARIRILLRMIDECGGTLELTWNEIGRLLGLGEARVRRLFRREVGKAVQRHLLEVRMARAAQLLRNAAAPIKTIAADCGYTAVSNFYRDFKRVHGISPRQMRLSHMSAEPNGHKPVLTISQPSGHSAAANDDQRPSLRLVTANRKISA